MNGHNTPQFPGCSACASSCTWGLLFAASIIAVVFSTPTRASLSVVFAPSLPDGEKTIMTTTPHSPTFFLNSLEKGIIGPCVEPPDLAQPMDTIEIQHRAAEFVDMPPHNGGLVYGMTYPTPGVYFYATISEQHQLLGALEMQVLPNALQTAYSGPVNAMGVLPIQSGAAFDQPTDIVFTIDGSTPRPFTLGYEITFGINVIDTGTVVFTSHSSLTSHVLVYQPPSVMNLTLSASDISVPINITHGKFCTEDQVFQQTCPFNSDEDSPPNNMDFTLRTQDLVNDHNPRVALHGEALRLANTLPLNATLSLRKVPASNGGGGFAQALPNEFSQLSIALAESAEAKHTMYQTGEFAVEASFSPDGTAPLRLFVKPQDRYCVRGNVIEDPNTANVYTATFAEADGFAEWYSGYYGTDWANLLSLFLVYETTASGPVLLSKDTGIAGDESVIDFFLASPNLSYWGGPSVASSAPFTVPPSAINATVFVVNATAVSMPLTLDYVTLCSNNVFPYRAPYHTADKPCPYSIDLVATHLSESRIAKFAHFLVLQELLHDIGFTMDHLEDECKVLLDGYCNFTFCFQDPPPTHLVDYLESGAYDCNGDCQYTVISHSIEPSTTSALSATTTTATETSSPEGSTSNDIVVDDGDGDDDGDLSSNSGIQGFVNVMKAFWRNNQSAAVAIIVLLAILVGIGLGYGIVWLRQRQTGQRPRRRSKTVTLPSLAPNNKQPRSKKKILQQQKKRRSQRRRLSQGCAPRGQRHGIGTDGARAVTVDEDMTSTPASSTRAYAEILPSPPPPALPSPLHGVRGAQHIPQMAPGVPPTTHTTAAPPSRAAKGINKNQESVQYHTRNTYDVLNGKFSNGPNRTRTKRSQRSSQRLPEPLLPAPALSDPPFTASSDLSLELNPAYEPSEMINSPLPRHTIAAHPHLHQPQPPPAQEACMADGLDERSPAEKRQQTAHGFPSQHQFLTSLSLRRGEHASPAFLSPADPSYATARERESSHFGDTYMDMSGINIVVDPLATTQQQYQRPQKPRPPSPYPMRRGSQKLSVSRRTSGRTSSLFLPINDERDEASDLCDPPFTTAVASDHASFAQRVPEHGNDEPLYSEINDHQEHF